MRLLASGDTALVAELGDTADRETNGRVLALAGRVEAARLAGVVELVPTFRSLMIHYDPMATSAAGLGEVVERLSEGLEVAEIPGRDVELPACYEGDLAPDLAYVAGETGLDPDEVVALHAAVTYRVYCLGFLPGYPYMGDTDPRLYLPRRTEPRVRVPMGSVCMAVGQTGIYSLESPGGWHLIARTPVRLFDPRRPQPVLLAPGDRVRFRPVSRAEHDVLDAAATAGRLDTDALLGRRAVTAGAAT